LTSSSRLPRADPAALPRRSTSTSTAVTFVYYDVGFPPRRSWWCLCADRPLWRAALPSPAPNDAMGTTAEECMSPLRQWTWLDRAAFANHVIVRIRLVLRGCCRYPLKIRDRQRRYPPIFIHRAFQTGQLYRESSIPSAFSTYHEQPDRQGCCDRVCARGRCARGLWHRPAAGAQAAVVILIARITHGLSYIIPTVSAVPVDGLLGRCGPQIHIHLG